MARPPRRVLFFSEAVTLAHVVRPLVLAAALDPELFEVHFACGSVPRWLQKDMASFETSPLRSSITSEQFLAAIARGHPPYDEQTLDAYVREELRLIDDVRPDAVIGDFRLTLAISAALRGLPYVNLTNSVWSPYCRQPMVVPDHPLVDRVGVTLARTVFRAIRPYIFRRIARPFNRICRRYGLRPLGDYPHVHSAGDLVLHLDVTGFVSMDREPAHHHTIGPLLYSADVPPPSCIDSLPRDLPWIYVSLGSSGDARSLHTLVTSLEALPVVVLVATAGRVAMRSSSPRVAIADYLPTTELIRRCAFVVCNGGSPFTYLALAQGRPVLGIPSNIDQHFNSAAVVRQGAGLVLRPSELDPTSIGRAVTQLLSDRSLAFNADRLAREIARMDAPRAFARHLARLVGAGAVAR